MQFKHKFSLSVFAFLASTNFLTAETTDYSSDVTAIEAELNELEEQASKYDDGLIHDVMLAREEILKLSLDAFRLLDAAHSTQVTVEYTIELPHPDQDRAAQLLNEITRQIEVVAQAETDASKSGGLVQALALSRAETEKLTLSQLQLGYFQALYGLPIFTEIASVGETQGDDEAGTKDPKTTDTSPTIDEVSEPSSRWAFYQENDDFTDKETSMVVLEASSRVGNDDPEALVVRCDGRGGYNIFMSANGYIGAQNDRIPVRYRFGDEAAISEKWSESTSGSAAFLPSNFNDFRTRLATGADFFFEITDYQGSRSSSEFVNNTDEKLTYVMGGCK